MRRHLNGLFYSAYLHDFKIFRSRFSWSLWSIRIEKISTVCLETNLRTTTVTNIN